MKATDEAGITGEAAPVLCDGGVKPLRIKDFSVDDRPQEKAIRCGVHTLSVSELWAVLLRTGQPGVPITQLTAALMNANDNRIKLLERRTRDELMTVKGIGVVKAVQIECVMELVRRYNREEAGEQCRILSSKDIFKYMCPRIGHLNHEEVWVVFLNNSNVVIGSRSFSIGSATATVFDLKGILREVLLRSAEGVILCHNHPSGTLKPSIQDDRITRQLKEATATLGIRMLDHLIVTQYSYYSYLDEGRL